MFENDRNIVIPWESLQKLFRFPWIDKLYYIDSFLHCQAEVSKAY